MGQRKPSGLYKRGKTWHIDKVIQGRRLYRSTDCSSLQEAIVEYEKLVSEYRLCLTSRPTVTFRQAATRYLREFAGIKSIADAAMHLKQLDPFIGNFELPRVHDDSLKAFVDHRLSLGKKKKTVNLALGVVRRILNLAARSWRHSESDLTWLDTPPLITMLPLDDSRRAYTLEWDEQERLLRGMLSYLSEMALYKVNTGCREQEVINLEWSWEWKTDMPELDGRIFIIPGSFRKKVRDRVMDDKIVVLNDIAKSVVDSRRGIHADYVFTYRDRKVKRMNNNGWRSAWRKAGLPINDGYLRGVHNLRHTFSTRLRLLGVSNETRRDLMGHTVGNMTSHYSAAGIMELLKAVQLLCKSRKSPALSIVKIRSGLQTA